MFGSFYKFESRGKLLNIYIDNVDFENKKCVVFGKGNKEKSVYFDARTKIHLQISGVKIRLRNLSRSLGIHRVYLLDTIMHYAMVNQNNVKESYRKYVT